MNLDDTKKRVQKYLNSNKRYPLIVDVQTREDLANIAEYFKVGSNKFPAIEEFCNQDEAIKLDELYASVSSNSGNTFITGLSGFLMLFGENVAKQALKTLITTSISGHVVIITYQCEKYLRFTDPRISESGRLVIVDGNPDNICNINFISPVLSDIFTDSYSGIQNIGTAIDSCFNRDAYIATAIDKSSFAESVFHISQVNNSYDILRNKDSRTGIVPQACGLPEQWDYVLHQMGKSGTWTTVIVDNFGSENNLLHVISEYPKFDVEKRWLYYIALLICGVKNNDYLKLALNKTSKSSELIKNIFRSVLDIDWKSENYQKLYRQRKSLISELKKPLPETIDFCKILSTKGEDEIYYLTDLTQPEKEKIIKWLSNYGVKYSKDELVSILMNVYPDLAYYLSSYRYRNEFLNTYFENYKYQKITNRILPSFDKVVEEQAIKMDFVTILKPRTAYVDQLDTQNAQVFFVDAMGVEYLSFIQQKCSEYGLSANISCARCELPSLTVFNKEFVDVLKDKGCLISDIKDLDDIKHHGKDSHIWKQIEIIENCRVKEYEKQKDKLILFLSLLLKDDWERAKKEVIGEPAKGIITVCLLFAIIFSWVGIFQANGINIRDVKEVQKGIIYTSPGMILIIMGVIVWFLIINVLKQHTEGESWIEIIVFDIICIIAIASGIWGLVAEKEPSIFIQAAIGMIIFSGALSSFLDIGKYVQRNRYKSYVDKIKGDEKAVQNS